MITVSGLQKVTVVVVGQFRDLASASSSAPNLAKQKRIPYIGSGKEVVVVTGDQKCGFSPTIISAQGKIAPPKEEESNPKLRVAIEKAKTLAQKNTIVFVNPLGHIQE